MSISKLRLFAKSRPYKKRFSRFTSCLASRMSSEFSTELQLQLAQEKVRHLQKELAAVDEDRALRDAFHVAEVDRLKETLHRSIANQKLLSSKLNELQHVYADTFSCLLQSGLPQLQVIVLEIAEWGWRRRIEDEAIQYFLLRSAGPLPENRKKPDPVPTVEHVHRTPSVEVDDELSASSTPGRSHFPATDDAIAQLKVALGIACESEAQQPVRPAATPPPGPVLQRKKGSSQTGVISDSAMAQSGSTSDNDDGDRLRSIVEHLAISFFPSDPTTDPGMPLTAEDAQRKYCQGLEDYRKLNDGMRALETLVGDLNNVFPKTIVEKGSALMKQRATFKSVGMETIDTALWRVNVLASQMEEEDKKAISKVELDGDGRLQLPPPIRINAVLADDGRSLVALQSQNAALRKMCRQLEDQCHETKVVLEHQLAVRQKLIDELKAEVGDLKVQTRQKGIGGLRGDDLRYRSPSNHSNERTITSESSHREPPVGIPPDVSNITFSPERGGRIIHHVPGTDGKTWRKSSLSPSLKTSRTAGINLGHPAPRGSAQRAQGSSRPTSTSRSSGLPTRTPTPRKGGSINQQDVGTATRQASPSVSSTASQGRRGLLYPSRSGSAQSDHAHKGADSAKTSPSRSSQWQTAHVFDQLEVDKNALLEMEAIARTSPDGATRRRMLREMQRTHESMAHHIPVLAESLRR